MLTTAAFNALLKTLEEPPEHVKFMFATTDPEKVLATILSRCQRFDLRRIPVALIAKHLTYIAGAEKVTIHPAALHAIARGAEGALRDAESTLDQLISFCGDHIEEADVLSMFGLTAQSQLLALSVAVLAGEVENALRLVNDLATNGKDLGRLLTDLLNHFRNLLIFQVSRGDPSMIEVTETEAAALAEQSKMATAPGLTRILEVLTDAEMRLRNAASKKILIEVALLRAIESRNAMSLDSVLKQLQDLRQGKRIESAPARLAPAPSPASPAPAATPAPAPAPAPVATSAVTSAERPPAPAAAPQPTGNLQELWSAILEAVGRVSPFTRSYLIEAHPVSLIRNLFTIGFDPEFEDHLALVDNARNHSLLQTKLAELGHPGLQFKFIKAEAPATNAAAPAPASAPAPAPAPTVPAAKAPPPAAAAKAAASPPPAKEKLVAVPFSKDDFKNDPLIQKALEIFKGQIVEVRA